MRKQIIVAAIVSILLGLGLIAIRHIDSLNDGIELKKIELKDNSAKLQILNTKYDEVLKQLDSQDADKAKLEQQLQDLQKEREKLQKDLQAKLDAKTKDAAAKAANTLTGSQKAYAADGNAETTIWNFLIAHGYTREQTAGIMGNLQQEHSFNTSDVAGGLGIAQWLGGRRANLMARPNYLDLNIQLQFLLDELNGPESKANAMVKASNTVAAATLAFQNGFERCGNCMYNNRLSYANAIYSRH